MASMARPNMSFPEWYQNMQIGFLKSVFGMSDAPLDKDVYQPYTNKTGRIKVIVPQVIDENTNKLFERIGSRKDIVVVLQLLSSNLDWFMLENYRLYSQQARGTGLFFHDILVYCGGKTSFANKMQLNTREKFKKCVDRMIGTKEYFCNVCFESGSDLNFVSCEVCDKTICTSCDAKWCLAKGTDVSCPMCRAKPEIVRVRVP